MANELINWLEIPVNDMYRAREFYETVFERSFEDLEIGGDTYPCLPNKAGDNYVMALVQNQVTTPGKKGPLVYLDSSPDITAMLHRISQAGGIIIQDKELIAPGMGHYAIFEDTEGNVLALQSGEDMS